MEESLGDTRVPEENKEPETRDSAEAHDASFSTRHDYAPPPPAITVREDAPPDFRAALLDFARTAGLREAEPFLDEDGEIGGHSEDELLPIIQRVLRRTPNPNSLPIFDQSADELLMGCEWYAVYDIAEAVYEELEARTSRGSKEKTQQFASQLNDFMICNGIGWQMVKGKLQIRGPEAFEVTVARATEALAVTERPTAANEMHEALGDLSRRPEPDRTGAIQHAIAALECTSRDICGDSATLGKLLNDHPEQLGIPKPLDTAVDKLWGYASTEGRHLLEGQDPSRAEAELVVHVSAAVISCICTKNAQ